MLLLMSFKGYIYVKICQEAEVDTVGYFLLLNYFWNCEIKNTGLIHCLYNLRSEKFPIFFGISQETRTQENPTNHRQSEQT